MICHIKTLLCSFSPLAKMPRLVAECMQAILDEGGTARKRGMRLKGFDYATELSQSLLKHARIMEQWYDTLQGALTCSPKKPEKFFIDSMAQINLKRKWYEEAQASVGYAF